MKFPALTKVFNFMGHYGEEIRLVGNVLNSLSHSFLDQNEKEAIAEAISRFEAAANNIAEALPALKEVSEISISKADVKEAVKELLPDIVANVVKEMSKSK